MAPKIPTTNLNQPEMLMGTKRQQPFHSWLLFNDVQAVEWMTNDERARKCSIIDIRRHYRRQRYKKPEIKCQLDCRPSIISRLSCKSRLLIGFWCSLSQSRRDIDDSERRRHRRRHRHRRRR